MSVSVPARSGGRSGCCGGVVVVPIEIGGGEMALW